MKTKIYLLLLFMSFCGNFTFAQHENDNWRFGNNNWKFDSSTPNGFTHATNINPYIRYASSVISDKNTGQLLFYSDGYKIYNKNNMVMLNGDDLFGINNNSFNTFGNPSDQSSIIVPLPNSNSIFYVFYINGNKKIDDQNINSDLTSYNYGLRYAIVDMTLAGGLGAVTSKNILFSNSPTNALTSTIGSDGNSYWIITANNGNFLSYRLTPSGLNITPTTSPATNYGNFFKISPNSKKLVTRININPNKGIYLYDFNNTSGAITNQQNILVNSFGITQTQYVDHSDFNNSIEFSANSEIIYFTSWDGCLCINPAATSAFHKYRIADGIFSTSPSTTYGRSFSLQRAENGKIYAIGAYIGYPTTSTRVVNFGWESTPGSTILNNSYEWKVINSPDNFINSFVEEIYPQLTQTKNGYSFPQLVPHLNNVNACPDVLNITQQVTASQNFQAGQSIIASSAINDDLIVNYKAGQNVTLLPDFHVKATRGSLFRAYIGPCDGIIENFAKNSNSSVNSNRKDILKPHLISEVKIFPNPASTYINIDSGNEKIIAWELYDLSGKNILKGNSNQVNVQSLPRASYLLKINIDNKITTKKVIVK